MDLTYRVSQSLRSCLNELVRIETDWSDPLLLENGGVPHEVLHLMSQLHVGANALAAQIDSASQRSTALAQERAYEVRRSDEL